MATVKIYFASENRTSFAPTFQIPSMYGSYVENIQMHEQN
jgi:hypothetical protein